MTDCPAGADLDDPNLYAEIDPQRAHERLFDLAGQCRAAWEIITRWTPTPLTPQPRTVVVAGMGGSAVGGELVGALVADASAVPLIVHRDYGLPAYVGPDSLVLASSYSGNTEETLSAADEAHRRKACLVAVTTGGELARRARRWGAPLLTFDYPAQPREALGYSLLLLLGALVRLGLLPDPTSEVQEAIATLQEVRGQIELNVPRGRNEAKDLAGWICGHTPLVCGTGLLAPVASRWKAQFNENSKAWAYCEQLPEMDHNAISGTANPAGFAQRVRGIFLTSDEDPERSRLRQEVTRRLLEEAGVACRTVHARGTGRLARMLTSVLLGDATSYYLAMLYRVDPTAIPAIHALKEAMRRA